MYTKLLINALQTKILKVTLKARVKRDKIYSNFTQHWDNMSCQEWQHVYDKSHKIQEVLIY